MSSALRLFTAEIPMWFSDTSNNTQEPGQLLSGKAMVKKGTIRSLAGLLP